MLTPGLARRDLERSATAADLARGRELAGQVGDLDWDEYSVRRQPGAFRAGAEACLSARKAWRARLRVTDDRRWPAGAIIKGGRNGELGLAEHPAGNGDIPRRCGIPLWLIIEDPHTGLDAAAANRMVPARARAARAAAGSAARQPGAARGQRLSPAMGAAGSTRASA